MTVGEFVKINGSTLELLSKHDIRIDDFKYTELYNDFVEMAQYDKVSYVVVCLSEKYKISEASVYRILKRFKATI